MNSPATMLDFYKCDHKSQSPEGLTSVFSNFTPRSTRLFNGSSMFDDKILNFGLRGTVKINLVDLWNEKFFNMPVEKIVNKFKRRMNNALGKDTIKSEHIRELHALGYLPIVIKALPEGTRTKAKVATFTITETNPRFAWLVNYLETLLSVESWKAATMATTAFEFRRIAEKYCELTGGPRDFVKFQIHDFSMRGLPNIYDAWKNGPGHLTCFVGTDTIPAIDGAEDLYDADSDNELIGTSVYASEHAVITTLVAEYIHKNGMDIDRLEDLQIAERNVLIRLITKVYPTGLYSHVSDSYDYWYLISKTLRDIKDFILAREVNDLGFAKLVIRPDTGIPEKIICGLEIADITPYLSDVDFARPINQIVERAKYQFNTEFYDGFQYGSKVYDFNGAEIAPEIVKGSLEVLWDIFGGTINAMGFRELNPRIGMIYGDSITMPKAESIFKKMLAMGFASTNILLGAGSYSYAYMTRDTLGYAMKATRSIVDGVSLEVYKKPLTDIGNVKASARGLIMIKLEDGEYVQYDQVTDEEEASDENELKIIFKDSVQYRMPTFRDIRDRVDAEIEKLRVDGFK